MENLLVAIKVLKDFNIEYDPISKLQQVSKILWANNIKPTDIIMAIDLLEDNDEEEENIAQAEEHIDQAIEDLEKIYKQRKYI